MGRLCDTSWLLPITTTFLRNSSRSCIDYIFVSDDLYPFTSFPLVDFINPLWTDHQLVSAELHLGQAPLGPGLWRCNPALAHDDSFCSELYTLIDKTFPDLDITLTSQQKWDCIKHITGCFARTYSRQKGTHNHRHLRSLQKERPKYITSNNNIDLQHDPYIISLKPKLSILKLILFILIPFGLVYEGEKMENNLLDASNIVLKFDNPKEPLPILDILLPTMFVLLLIQ